MKKILLLLLLFAGFLTASAQNVPLVNGWKFRTGDSTQWATPNYNDRDWQPISILHSWESQGHDKYDGFGWYRLHTVIPSALKDKAFFKDSIRFEMGYGDDGYDVYLNGKLIGRNNNGDIKTGLYGLCKIVIGANNPAILWNKENVISVRIFDSGGNGGIYGDKDKFKISMVDVMDNAYFNTDGDFIYGDKNSLSKSIKIATSSNYSYKGKLDFKVTDPETNAVIYQKTNDADFSAGRPFTYTFNIAELAQKSYLITYTFTDEKSGEKLMVRMCTARAPATHFCTKYRQQV